MDIQRDCMFQMSERQIFVKETFSLTILLDQIRDRSLLRTRHILAIDLDDVIARLEATHRCWTVLSHFTDERWTIPNDCKSERIIATARDHELNENEQDYSARVQCPTTTDLILFEICNVSIDGSDMFLAVIRNLFVTQFSNVFL
jgi:hypothetical protein